MKTEILRLTEKYSMKCVEASKLEETITYLKAQLNEAKRRIFELEANDFQTSISSASKVKTTKKRLSYANHVHVISVLN